MLPMPGVLQNSHPVFCHIFHFCMAVFLRLKKNIYIRYACLL